MGKVGDSHQPLITLVCVKYLRGLGGLDDTEVTVVMMLEPIML